MYEKDNNVLDIEEFAYYGEFELVANTLLKWSKAKSDHKELDNVVAAFSRIGIYVKNMQERQRQYDIQLSRFRADKLRAVERARKVEDENANLLKDLKECRKLI
jgi:hypothetical protein